MSLFREKKSATCKTLLKELSKYFLALPSLPWTSFVFANMTWNRQWRHPMDPIDPSTSVLSPTFAKSFPSSCRKSLCKKMPCQLDWHQAQKKTEKPWLLIRIDMIGCFCLALWLRKQDAWNKPKDLKWKSDYASIHIVYTYIYVSHISTTYSLSSLQDRLSI